MIPSLYYFIAVRCSNITHNISTKRTQQKTKAPQIPKLSLIQICNASRFNSSLLLGGIDSPVIILAGLLQVLFQEASPPSLTLCV